MTDKGFLVLFDVVNFVKAAIVDNARLDFELGFRYPVGRNWRIETVTELRSAKHLDDIMVTRMLKVNRTSGLIYLHSENIFNSQPSSMKSYVGIFCLR